MKAIKVLGSCCGNCGATVALIEQVADAKGVDIDLEKVEELRDIVKYGVMSTPAVVIDGKVVHAGGVPSRDKIEGWLAAEPVAAGCCGSSPSLSTGSSTTTACCDSSSPLPADSSVSATGCCGGSDAVRAARG